MNQAICPPKLKCVKKIKKKEKKTQKVKCAKCESKHILDYTCVDYKSVYSYKKQYVQNLKGYQSPCVMKRQEFES